jgi:hypothetical protein
LRGGGAAFKLESPKAAKLSGTSGKSVFKGTISGTSTTIECSKDSLSGELDETKDTLGTIELKECVVSAPSGCTAKGFDLKFKGQLTGSSAEDELKPETGTSFGEVTIEGCSIAGTYKITGTQKCELASAETAKTTHEIVCKTTGSSLELDGAAATFESTEEVELEGKENWFVEEEEGGTACGSGEHWVACYFPGEGEIGTPPQEVSGTTGEAIFQGTVSGVSAEFKCSSGAGSGFLELLGAGKGTIKLSSCKEIKPAGCKLSSAEETGITASATAQLGAHPATPVALFTGSNTGEEFTTLEVLNESGCTIAGNYVVHGMQTCELPEATTEKAKHEVKCKKSGSELFIGAGTSNKASFSSTSSNVELLGGTHAGLGWYVDLGE